MISHGAKLLKCPAVDLLDTGAAGAAAAAAAACGSWLAVGLISHTRTK